MVIKVVSYFDVPGKFSVEEGNEIVRDLRVSIAAFLAKTQLKSFPATLSNGKKIEVRLLSEAEARQKVVNTLKINDKLISDSQKKISEIEELLSKNHREQGKL